MDRVDDILAQWARVHPGLPTEAMGLIGRILRLESLLMRGMEASLALHGLNFPAFDVLATLRRASGAQGLTPGGLLAETMVTSGTMTNRLDRLEAAGLIARVADPEDARCRRVVLTPAGIAKIDSVLADYTATQARLANVLPEPDRAALAGLLRRWLEAHEPQPVQEPQFQALPEKGGVG